MALPMDEQRILDEMERMLAADDPRLAARLAAFGRPGLSQVLRTGRARAALALMIVAVAAAVAVVVYLMGAFRLGVPQRPQPPRASHKAQRVVAPSARAGNTPVFPVLPVGSAGNGSAHWQCGTLPLPAYCRALVSAAARER
jgi:hypothetical protein